MEPFQILMGGLFFACVIGTIVLGFAEAATLAMLLLGVGAFATFVGLMMSEF